MCKERYCHRLALAVQAGILMGSLGLFIPAAWAAPAANTLPTGGISATAVISASGKNMTVDGKAAHNVIAWDSFSIGKDAAVNFTGKHDYLNYVTGKSLSEIFGTMSGGNRVYLINPNGIILGESAKINVGSLYASTRQLTEDDISKFSSTGVLNSTKPTMGDVVNRMENDLGNMEITLEGDTVTFAKTVYDRENNKLTLGNGGRYSVYSTGLDIGYSLTDEDMNSQEYQVYLDKISDVAYKNNGNGPVLQGTIYENPFAPKADTIVTNLSGETPVPVYCQLIGQNNLSIPTKVGNYMLSEDITGSITHSKTSFYYTGVFDGAGHTVTLTGKPLFEWDGILGIYDSNIRNLTIKGNVTATHNGNTGVLFQGDWSSIYYYVSDSTIANVFNEADINIKCTYDSYISDNIGGLAGVMRESKIKNSGNKGDISVEHEGTRYDLDFYVRVGGLAAFLIDSDIERAYNEGAITVTGANPMAVAGGLAGGLVNSIIKDSYNTGNISGAHGSGGLVGLSEVSETNARSVIYENVFNSGSIQGSLAAGGLVSVFVGDSKFNNAYNTGDITGGAVGIGEYYGATAAEFGHPEINTDLSFKRIYNTGTVNGAPAYSYYDASGTKHEVASAAAIASSGAFSSFAWRTYSGQMPVLSSLLSKVYLPESTGTGANGQPEYRVYAYQPGHLQGYVRNYGNALGLYKNGTYSDQFGYDLRYDTPNLTIPRGNEAGPDDPIVGSGLGESAIRQVVEEYNQVTAETPKQEGKTYAETYEMEKLDVVGYTNTRGTVELGNQTQQGSVTEETMNRILTGEGNNDNGITPSLNDAGQMDNNSGDASNKDEKKDGEEERSDVEG